MHTIIKELIKNDVIVLTTGCNGIACATHGLLTPETAAVYCGPGLAEVCETVGIPPVLHLGSCVDNSRILLAATEVVKAGGLGKDISDLPAAGSAPEWMSEKAISIGHYFVSSGVYTVFGYTFPTTARRYSRITCSTNWKNSTAVCGIVNRIPSNTPRR
jgi:carbon-monoxide dehydrogenase catalytic subunit